MPLQLGQGQEQEQAQQGRVVGVLGLKRSRDSGACKWRPESERTKGNTI